MIQIADDAGNFNIKRTLDVSIEPIIHALPVEIH